MNDFVLCTNIVEFHNVIELSAEYSKFVVSLSVQILVWTNVGEVRTKEAKV